MARILVYDTDANRVYSMTAGEDDPMPYSYGTTLRVREFRGSSGSPTLWTTTQAMECWNLTRRSYASGIFVGYAFKRIWEGGHSLTSQHYAGVSFDVGQTLSDTGRQRLWNLANNLGVWGYVEPIRMTPSWVHFDRRYGRPACSGTTSGYPTLRVGSRGVYVLVMQDALNALGYPTYGLDGLFGQNTRRALTNWQADANLAVDGVCGCNSWRRLTAMTVGIGRTASVID